MRKAVKQSILLDAGAKLTPRQKWCCTLHRAVARDVPRRKCLLKLGDATLKNKPVHPVSSGGPDMARICTNSKSRHDKSSRVSFFWPQPAQDSKRQIRLDSARSSGYELYFLKCKLTWLQHVTR